MIAAALELHMFVDCVRSNLVIAVVVAISPASSVQYQFKRSS